MKHWSAEITNAKSLEELYKLLREAGERNIAFHPLSPEPTLRLDITCLPTFGGDPPPPGTVPVWSWDRRSVLIGPSFRDLRIMPRKGWRRWMQVAS